MRLHHHGAMDLIDLGSGHNTFDGEQAQSLLQILLDIGSSDRPLALVASGKHWCTGLDLEWMRSHRSEADRTIADVHEAIGTLVMLPRPTVAAISGHAFGAGAMLAMACDFRVMNGARGHLCFPEVDLGLAPTRPMTNLLIARVGRTTAAEVLLSGYRYTASEAAERGLVDRVVQGEELLEGVSEVTKRAAGKDPATVAAIKRRVWGRVADDLRAARGQIPPFGGRV